MGGLLRDMLIEKLCGMPIQPGDVDLVIDGAGSTTELQEQLVSFFLSRNDFGGVKCRVSPNGVIFDIWRIEDHVNIRFAPQPHTILQLLQHNLIDIDGILWNAGNGDLHDYGSMAAVNVGRIDLLGSSGISPAFLSVQAAHVIVVAHKTGFSISEQARQFIGRGWEDHYREKLVEVVKRKLRLNGCQATDLVLEFLATPPSYAETGTK